MQIEKRNTNSKNKTKQDFRLYLQDELASRCARNPSYSLRSFAKFLDVSPSALSAMLSGKRPITHRMKERMGLKMGLDLNTLGNLKSKAHGNSKLLTDSRDQLGFQQITIDTFAIISEPYHYAILELLKTEDFKWESKWIAQRLKITVSEVNIAIERLERVGLLDRDENGNLVDTTNGFSTDIREGLSTHGQRRFQQRSLENAVSAIHSIPIDQRDNTSMTMAINVGDLPKAKQMIKDFRRKFCRHMEDSINVNEVYQLTISFIPLTNKVGVEK